MKSSLIPALPTRPLAIIGVALGMLALPLWDHAAPWSIVVLLLALAARLFLNVRSLPLPPGWMKLLVLATSTAAVLIDYGTLVAVESAFGILLILIGLKVCEANHARDLQVLTLLGFFLALCDLFFEQDLGRWLYVGGAFLLVMTGRIYFYQPEAARGWRRSLWQGLRLLAQALPLTVLLFLFFPRIYGDFKFILPYSQMGTTGLPEKLLPGSVASLAMRTDVAFRVSFPDKNMPPAPQLYWRGLVLWDGAGLNWERGGPGQHGARMIGMGGPTIRQHIMLKPYGDTWLFALDRPSGPVLHAYYEAGGALRSQRQFYTEFSYNVDSRLENKQTTIPPDEMRAATRRPSRVSANVQELADSWRSGAANEETVVARALLYFKSSGFTYSLSPGVYLSPELDEFLFKRRVGFCEHYASAFATLMRLAGIPSRVVLGYQGGEYNEIASYLIVHQSDAHAWCEVWMRGRGWVRVDPTSVIAPDRVNAGLQGYMESDARFSPALASHDAATVAWRDFQRSLRLYWDNLSYQWNLRVLSFDRDSQLSFLAVLGILDWNSYSMATAIAFASAILLGAVLIWLRRTPAAARGDLAFRWYARYCRQLAKVGVVRGPAEGPLHLAARAATHLPAHAKELSRIGLLYASLRYSAHPPPLAEFIEAIRKLPKLALAEHPMGK